MEIENLSPGGFAANCYLVINGQDAILIDPTAPLADLKGALARSGAKLHAILLTHGHFDHILTADQLREAFNAPILVHSADNEMLDNGEKNASFPFFGHSICCAPADRLIANNDTLSFGSITLTVMHTPGHTKGSVVYLAEGIAFTGDTLFADGYGRTDLYGGSYPSLVDSLRALLALDGSIRIYPGHGRDTLLSRVIPY